MKKIKTDMLELFSQIDPEGKLVSESVQNDFADAIVEMAERQVAAKVSKIRKLTAESTQPAPAVVSEDEIQQRIKAAVLAERKRVLELSKEKILSERAKVIEQAKQKINEAKAKAAIVESSSSRKVEICEMQEQLVEMISQFLDEHIESVRPVGEVISEHEIKQLKKFRQTVRDLTIANEMDLKTEIRESFEDGLETINSLKKQIKTLTNEKKDVASKLDEATKKNLLSDKLSGLAPKKRAFLESMFKDSSVLEIEEKFNEAKAAFEQDEVSKRKAIAESKKAKPSVAPKAIVPESVNPKSRRKPLVENKEEVSEQTVDPMMQQYVNSLNRTNLI